MEQEINKRRRPPYKEFLAWMVIEDVSRKQITDLLGLSDSSLSQRLNGKGPDFTPEEIRTLVRKYGKHVASFFYFD